MSELELWLFEKKAKLPNSSCGHDSVIDIYGLNGDSMLLYYAKFSTWKLSVDYDPVSNLKESLWACDIIFDYNGFGHLGLQQFFATGVISGLGFLYERSVAYPDLFSDNLPISNRHYQNCCDVELLIW